MAQGVYYSSNPNTVQIWMIKVIGSLLDFSLGLWKNICSTIHGVTEEDKKKILEVKIVKQVKHDYGYKDKVSKDYLYLFT